MKTLIVKMFVVASVLTLLMSHINKDMIMCGEKPVWMNVLEVSCAILLVFVMFRTDEYLRVKPKNLTVELFVDTFKSLAARSLIAAFACIIVAEIAYEIVPDSQMFNMNWFLLYMLVFTMLIGIWLLVACRKVENAVERFDENTTEEDVMEFIKSLYL